MKIKAIKEILNHPMTKHHRLKYLIRYVLWGFHRRLYSEPIIHRWLDSVLLMVGKGMTSAELNYFMETYDYEEMQFLLRYLCAQDVFVDVGANVGVYTLLAAGVCNAKAYAFEPDDANFAILQRNICLNNLDDKVSAFKNVVGFEEKEVQFTIGQGAIGKVLNESIPTEISFTTKKSVNLDQALLGNYPTVIKMDVEGYEMNVLKGATHILKSEKLKAVILEINDLHEDYGFDKKDIFYLMENNGFKPCRFYVESGKVKEANKNGPNLIFIKDLDEVNRRIKNTYT